MQVKEVKSINFLYFRTEATVAALHQFLPVSKELYREAVNHDLQITGPVHWHYYNFSMDESKPFILEVALPVAETLSGYDGKFHFKRTQPFKCVTAIHEGAWNELPLTYGKMMQFLSKHKLEYAAANRELYLNADFKNPEANITEVQIGINA
jgi:effector-binding domain-containing protein